MKILVIFAVLSIVNAQSDGGFWWLNKNLMKGAAESRSIKDQSAKIRTLPPRYRGSEVKTTTTARNSIFGDDDEEEQKMFKYDDEPDCACTPKYLCNENNTIITDGNGIIDER
jgi:Serine protease Clip domain PPAF-2